MSVLDETLMMAKGEHPMTRRGFLVKTAVSLGISMSAGYVVTKAINIVIPAKELPALAKVGMFVGTYAISSYVGDTVAEHTVEQIDKYYDVIKEIVYEVEEEASIIEEERKEHQEEKEE